MYCMNCGKELLDDARFCTECGEPVIHVIQQEEVLEEDIVEEEGYYPGKYYDYDETGYTPIDHTVHFEETINPLYGLIGIFIPLIGFIMYIAMKQSKPKNAAFCLRSAIIGMIINAVLLLFL